MHRVEKFDQQRQLSDAMGQFGGGNGQFVHSYGIAVDSSNNVYVTDSATPALRSSTATAII
jgi:hypothetical protein